MDEARLGAAVRSQQHLTVGLTGPAVSEARAHTQWSQPGRVALVLALILCAYILPRAAAFSSHSLTSALRFGDMHHHLLFADQLAKHRSLTPDQARDPFLRAHGDDFKPEFSINWPQAIHQLTAVWSGIFGAYSLWTVQLTNLIFTLILLAGVIDLGSILGNVRMGL